MQSEHDSGLVDLFGLLLETLPNRSVRWPKSVGAFLMIVRIRRLRINLHRRIENESAHSVLCRLELVREDAVRS